jgi:hypothetical protein
VADVTTYRRCLKSYAGVPVQAVTCVAGTDLFTAAGHGYGAGKPVRFYGLAGGAGITAGTTTYFVIASGLTADAFRVSATLGGSTIDVTTDVTAGGVAATDAQSASHTQGDLRPATDVAVLTNPEAWAALADADFAATKKKWN